MKVLSLRPSNFANLAAGLAGRLTNLGMLWKLVLIALMIPVTALAVAGAALNNTDRLKYQYDNLYGFMLIPIMAGGQVKGVLGVGNKASDYSQDDVDALQKFGNGVWATIESAKK